MRSATISTGPSLGLREEVAQRPVETPREHDALAFLRHQRERAVELEHGIRVGGEEPALGIGLADVPQTL